MKEESAVPTRPPIGPDVDAQDRAPTKKRILVCGGRDYRDFQQVFGVLDSAKLEYAPTLLLIISGGAMGADNFALLWAKRNRVEHVTYKADWTKYGGAAGPIRNQRMLDSGKPDLVIAFPGGRGTEDMLRRANAAGVPVIDGAPMRHDAGVSETVT